MYGIYVKKRIEYKKKEQETLILLSHIDMEL